MLGDAFSHLLNDLGKYINMNNLQPNERNTCMLSFPSKDVKILLMPDSALLNLRIICYLGEIAQGRYQEEVFHEALRANSIPNPRYGNLGYNSANNNLVLWEVIPFAACNGADLAEFLQKYIDKAAEIHDAIKNNAIPSLVARTTVRTGGLFGLR
ncbi:MAG: CesT family type III secretion system chaperone [Parachlamydiales bacterium]|jgi:hypothetical protein